MNSCRIEASPIGRIVVPPGVPSGFDLFWTTRDFDGVLDRAGRDLVRGALVERGIAAGLTTCGQVHGVNVVRSEPAREWSEFASCDALWAVDRPASLGIKAADCLPVTLVDTGSGVIGNAHAGWRGALAGVVPRLIDSIMSYAGIDGTAWSVWLGPSIRRCCFEVGEDVVEKFEAEWPSAGRWIDRSLGPKPHLDLAAMTIDLLVERGISNDAIFDSGLCTRCLDGWFHSWRRDRERAGRNLAIVSRA